MDTDESNLLFLGQFSAKYIAYIILTMTMLVRSRGFISLPHFMLLGAVVSEICESKPNKKEKEKNNFENGNFS